MFSTFVNVEIYVGLSCMHVGVSDQLLVLNLKEIN